jgi:hypothetical protein
VDHTIAVAYSLYPSRSQLIVDWNSDARCSDLALALEPPPRREAYAAELLDAFLMVLGTVSTSVASSAVYDMLKSCIAHETGKSVTYRTIELPDGTKVTEFTESG